MPCGRTALARPHNAPSGGAVNQEERLAVPEATVASSPALA